MVNLEKLRNLWYKITDLDVKLFWINIRRWLSYYKVIRNTYDFDYTSLLEIELHQLTKLRDCITKYQTHVHAWHNIKTMNLAISCLNIVLEGGCSFSNKVRPFIEKELPNGLVSLLPNPEYKYYMPVYVNTRNAKRFVEYKGSTDALYQDNLRIQKAWYLYNKIKYYYLFSWWD